MIITKYFTPKRSFQRLAKIKTPLDAVSRIEGVWVKLWGFFPLSGLFWGRRVFLEGQHGGVFAASRLISWKDETSG